jgi:hypothetical protein
MVRVAVFCSGQAIVYIGFDTIPLRQEDGFRCIPDGTVSCESARQIALALSAGRIKGQVEGHPWYRQAGGSSGRQALTPGP